MVQGLTSCTVFKTTPTSDDQFSMENPTGVIPQFIHISCKHDAAPYTEYGYAREAWILPQYGIIITTNGSSGTDALYASYPTDTMSVTNQRHKITETTIDIRKSATITGRWHTSTEYTIEIYI